MAHPVRQWIVALKAVRAELGPAWADADALGVRMLNTAQKRVTSYGQP